MRVPSQRRRSGQTRKRLRVGIVGCGRVAEHHLKFLVGREDTDVVALVDKNVERAAQLAETYGVGSRFSSLDKLFQTEAVDVLHVLTPPQHHFQHAAQAIKAGCHVLIEKPMTLSLQETCRLFALARKKNVKLCPDFIHLFNPLVLEAKALTRRHNLGRLAHAECYMAVDHNSPEVIENIDLHWSYTLPGGVIQDYLCHPLYLTLDWIGEPRRVTVFPRHLGRFPQRLTDHLDILLEAQSASAKITLTFLPDHEQYYLKLFFEKGVVTVDFEGVTVVTEKVSSLPRAVRRVVMNLNKARQLVSRSTSNVLRFVRGGLVPYEGLKKLIEAFYGWVRDEKGCPIAEGLVLNVSKAEEEILGKAGPVRLDLGLKASCQRGIRRKEKVLVTGATGYLGTEIVRRLVETGYYVRAYVRKISHTEALETMGVELTCGDVRDRTSFAKAAHGMDVIVHAAAALRGSESFILDTCLKGTRNAGVVARRAGVPRVIYISSLSVFEFLHIRDGTLLTEESPRESQPQKRGVASRAKRLAEDIAVANLSQNKVAWTILRPSLIFGNGRDLPSLIGPRVGNLLLSLGRKDKHLPLIHVRDVATAVITCIETEAAAKRVFNISHDDQITVKEFARTCLTAPHLRRLHVVCIPYSIALSSLMIVRAIALLLGKTPGMNRVRLAYGCRDILATGKAFSDATGWRSEEPLILQLKREAQPT